MDYLMYHYKLCELDVQIYFLLLFQWTRNVGFYRWSERTDKDKWHIMIVKRQNASQRRLTSSINFVSNFTFSVIFIFVNETNTAFRSIPKIDIPNSGTSLTGTTVSSASLFKRCVTMYMRPSSETSSYSWAGDGLTQSANQHAWKGHSMQVPHTGVDFRLMANGNAVPCWIFEILKLQPGEVSLIAAVININT